MTNQPVEFRPPLRHHLRTARLTLRPVAAADEAAVVAHLNDLAISGWLARVPVPYTAADFHQFATEIAYPGETFTIEDAQGFGHHRRGLSWAIGLLRIPTAKAMPPKPPVLC